MSLEQCARRADHEPAWLVPSSQDHPRLTSPNVDLVSVSCMMSDRKPCGGEINNSQTDAIDGDGRPLHCVSKNVGGVDSDASRVVPRDQVLNMPHGLDDAGEHGRTLPIRHISGEHQVITQDVPPHLLCSDARR